MKKLKLDTDELRVNSFEVAPAVRLRGTIAANESAQSEYCSASGGCESSRCGPSEDCGYFSDPIVCATGVIPPL